MDDSTFTDESVTDHTVHNLTGVPAAWWVSVAVPVILAVVSWLYYVYMLKPQGIIDRFRRQGIPGCEFRPFAGNVPEIQEAKKAAEKKTPSVKWAIPFLELMDKKFGGTYTYCFGSTPRLVTTDPALIRQIYIAKNDKFPKVSAGSGFRLLGNGLSNSSGDLWERQRRMMASVFSNKAVKELTQAVRESAEEAVASWLDKMGSASSAPFAMDEELHKLSLQSIGRAVFGADIAGMKPVAKEAAQRLGHYFEMMPKWLAGGGLSSGYRWLPTPMNRQLLDDETAIKTLLLGLISRRRSAQESRKVESNYGVVPDLPSIDFLELMLSTTDMEDSSSTQSKSKVGIDESGHMSDQQLMDECITLFVAGHETVAVTLMWTMFLLAKYPDWQKRLRDEVFQVCVEEKDSGKLNTLPRFEQLEELKNLDMVVHECLRIYPPTTVLARKCENYTSLVGLKCPMDTEIVLPVIQIHRMKEYWGSDMDDFKPERFAGGIEGAVRHPMAYLPFSAGPRKCIGQTFALSEMKMILVVILKSFKWQMALNYRHAPSAALTLKPKYGLPIILERLS